MKVIIEWQDRWHYWHKFQTCHHLQSEYKTAKFRAKNTNKRYRLVDERGRLLDLVEPQTKNQIMKFIRITEMYI